jgi:hypothetical protein
MSTLKSGLARIGRLLGLDPTAGDDRMARRFDELTRAHQAPGRRSPLFRR